MTQQLGPRQLSLVEALESGKYAQGRGFLSQLIEGREYHCCLGVACKENNVPRIEEREGKGTLFFRYKDETYDDENGWRSGYLPTPIMQLYALRSNSGLPADDGQSLASLNDSGRSFREIAAIIRDAPWNYFKEPR